MLLCKYLCQAKKLGSVLAIFMPETNGGKDIDKMSYIHYLVQFLKAQGQIKALFNSGCKVNVINPDFVQKLGFHIWKTNIKA